jgi:hypothetical protein
MSSKIDKDHLTITGAHERMRDSNVDIRRVDDGVIIVVTQAFGPKGDNLVGISDVTFDGFPAVTIGVRTPDAEGLVHLSPVHGDARKEGFTDIPFGTKCQVYCPVSGAPLDKVGDVGDRSGAEYYALYLTPRKEEGAMVMLSDIWGHYHSRIIDDMELVSYWANMEQVVRDSIPPPPPAKK